MPFDFTKPTGPLGQFSADELQQLAAQAAAAQGQALAAGHQFMTDIGGTYSPGVVPVGSGQTNPGGGGGGISITYVTNNFEVIQTITNVTQIYVTNNLFTIYQISPTQIIILPGPAAASRYERWWKDDGVWYYGGEPERAGRVGLSSDTLDNDVLFALPFLMAKGRTVEKVAFWLTAGGAGGKARLGIYTNTDDGLSPDAPIWRSDEIDCTPGQEGRKEVTACLPVPGDALYWLVLAGTCDTSGLGVKCVSRDELWSPKGTGDDWATDTAGCGVQATWPDALALPDVFPDFATSQGLAGNSSLLPAVGVKFGTDCTVEDGGGEGAIDLAGLEVSGRGTYTAPGAGVPAPVTVGNACCAAVPTTLTATFTGCGGGASACVGQSATLTYNGTAWVGNVTCGGLTWALTLTCALGIWFLNADCGLDFQNQARTGGTACSPLAATFNYGTWAGCCSLAGLVITVTE